MADAVVVVAIPQQHDHVWDISSEKVPHMTLLYLGEPDWTPEQFQNVIGFVEHAAGLINRFGMSVDHRGELGDDRADVLFFAKWRQHKVLEDFRQGLLANDDINRAYQAADQYPQWTPHLTLGYPHAPAKEDDRDYEIGWVEFDKISVWTQDFAGPTFDLKDQDYSMEVAMSGAPADAVASVLEHYGVKGMRWGKRGAAAGKASTQRTRYSKAPSKLSDKELTRRIKRLEMEKRYNQLNRPDVSEGRKLVAEVLSSSGKVIAAQTLQREGTAIVRDVLARRS